VIAEQGTYSEGTFSCRKTTSIGGLVAVHSMDSEITQVTDQPHWNSSQSGTSYALSQKQKKNHYFF
jgi:hypothetical protein